MPDALRAEFDGVLREKANLLGISRLSTATQIFELFDEAGGGILHITDLAAGLAVLCHGSLAQSIRYACRLYRGADGDMGLLDIYDFTLSIFKVRSFEPWPTSIDDIIKLFTEMLPAISASQVAAVVIHTYAVQRRK